MSNSYYELFKTVGGLNVGYATELLEKVEQQSNNGSNGRYASDTILVPQDGQFNSELTKLLSFINHIRSYGYKYANVNPLDESDYNPKKYLDPKLFGLSQKAVQYKYAKHVAELIEYPTFEGKNTLDLFNNLTKTYCGSIGYEFLHIRNIQEQNWLRSTVEQSSYNQDISLQQSKYLLELLTRTQTLEKFLYKAFPGSRWYSLEGMESVVVLLDRIVFQSTLTGVEKIYVGMAHRGRINLLAHIFGKPYNEILSEFMEGGYTYLANLESKGWMSDVKYHMGARVELDYDNDGTMDITMQLMPNPSHLEMVTPVVVGCVRAIQDEISNRAELQQVMGVILHGDAAFAGQGIVTETLNLSNLKGYHTGGTIHIVMNNQIGFTTDRADSFSSNSPCDVVRGFDVPIVHVNADDIPACLSVAQLAVSYRKRFGKDFVINLIGYRRFGHNETDDPTITQPSMYLNISSLKTVREKYANDLNEKGIVPIEESNQIAKSVLDHLYELKEQLDSISSSHETNEFKPDIVTPLSDLKVFGSINNSSQKLKDINKVICTLPKEFVAHRAVKRIFNRRQEAFEKGFGIDWAHAEALAFGSILQDNISIRFTGQDVKRGTFSQRHAVVFDNTTQEEFIPLSSITPGRFEIFNSPLCELAALAFEHGYSVFSNKTMVIWEAQFGDFVNNAQGIIDEMVVSSRAKWGQHSGLVILLPHGYEGQGPNHSHAYLERFLALAARGNISVVYPTTAAQYFHLLRAQAYTINKGNARPLIVMSAKSLLRNPLASSPLQSLEQGKFRNAIIHHKTNQDIKNVKRLILCSGKIFIDLVSNPAHDTADDFAVVRFEQLYPFPRAEIWEILSDLPLLQKIIWLQEEPRNRGAFGYISMVLGKTLNGIDIEYVGRSSTSTPAAGSAWLHKVQQNQLTRKALGYID